MNDFSDECPPFPELNDGQVACECRIVNKKGLHARASAKFVQTVELFEAEVNVTRCEETVNGLSIMGLMMLNAGLGSTIHIAASGVDKDRALASLQALIINKFGEDE
jgi:phosphocarrier protein HPr